MVRLIQSFLILQVYVDYGGSHSSSGDKVYDSASGKKH